MKYLFAAGLALCLAGASYACNYGVSYAYPVTYALAVPYCPTVAVYAPVQYAAPFAYSQTMTYAESPPVVQAPVYAAPVVAAPVYAAPVCVRQRVFSYGNAFSVNHHRSVVVGIGVHRVGHNRAVVRIAPRAPRVAVTRTRSVTRVR